MEYIPVGKRTRLQRALKKDKFVDNSGDFLSDDDDEEEACFFIDKSEFKKTSSCENSERNSAKKDVGLEKNITTSSNLSRVYDDPGEILLGLDDKGKRVMNDGGNDSVYVVEDVGVHVNDVAVHVDDGVDDDIRVDNNVDDRDDGVCVDDDGSDGVRVDDGDEGVLIDDDGNDGVCVDDDDDDDDDGIGGVGIDYGDDEKEGVPKVKLHKRVFEGLVLPTYVEHNNFIGKRTRSHYKTILPRKKVKNEALNFPTTIDLEESSSSHGEEEEEDLKTKSHEESREDDGGKKKKRGRPPSKKDEKVEVELTMPRGNSRVKRLSTSEVQNALLDEILKNGKNEGLGSVNSSYLPLKFRFGDEKLVPQKAEEEQQSECLFKDMDFALGICEIGLQASFKDNDEDDNAVLCDSAILQKKLCQEGKHYWILDDEIGIKCKFCSFVMLEIRDVTPDFNKDPFGRSEKDRFHALFPYNDTKVSDKFQFPDLSYDSRGDHSRPSVDHVSGTVWDLIPGTHGSLHPHQRDGFEFIWRNIAGGIRIDELDKATESDRGGCIICHAPGTGKTRLAIVFLQSFMKQYPMSRPVIIAPKSMIRTWEEEFARWNVDIPFFNFNEKELSGKEDLQLLKDYKQKLSLKDESNIRIAKLLTWFTGNGVLAISYGLFQTLAGDGKGVKKSKQVSLDKKSRQIPPNKLFRQFLLEFPGLLVLDEGHTPRNEKSNIFQVLSEVVTKKRVILSGTPFQNNFDELHNTIALVREEFGVPSCSHLNNDRRIEKLRKQIKPFVHVHNGEILRDTLGGLFHSLVVLRPSDLQKMIFDRLATTRSHYVKFDYLISVTSVHPSIFCEQEEPGLIDKEQEALLKEYKMDPNAGVKLRFLVELIKLCKGERVLVFGQSLSPLNFVGDLLKSLFQWTKGRELLYIDGNQSMKERQSLIRLFNNPKSEARVLLASTKACCEGISLVGASRVVLLDVVWNPSVERQAISRAYRLGQKKDVFVYQLITSGTLEEDKFRRQARKEHFSKLLFSSSSSEETTHKKSIGSRVVSEDHVLEAMTHHEKTKNMFEKIVSQPKADDLIKKFGPLNM